MIIMKSAVKHFLCTTLLLSTASLSANPIQSPSIWKATYSVLDADAAAAFCIDVLGMKKVIIPDPGLEPDHSWVTFGEHGPELHFVSAKDPGVREFLERFVISLDYSESAFTDWMNSHIGIQLPDLSPLITRLQERGVPFLGPVRRADGVYQLYIRIPGTGYLEFDSFKEPKERHKVLVTTWPEVWEKTIHSSDDVVIHSTDAYGGHGGNAFDSTLGWKRGDSIESVSFYSGEHLNALSVSYRSGQRLSFGNPRGEDVKTLQLGEDEYITEASICLKHSHYKWKSLGMFKIGGLINDKIVSFAEFSTNKGQSVSFGKSSEDCYYVLKSKGHRVIGFFGHAGEQIDSLGLKFLD